MVTEEQIIVGATITQEANDVNQMIPMLDATMDALAQAGIEDAPREVLSDTGYWNEEPIPWIAPFRPESPGPQENGRNGTKTESSDPF